MCTFGTQYRYECKKIWDRKIVKFSLLACLLLTAVTGTVRLLGDYVVDGEVVGTVYEEIRRDQAYAKALNGRPIGQRLLEEMVTAYRKVPETPGKHYSSSQAYQTYARPYSEIFNFTVASAGNLLPSEIFQSWEPSEQDLYQRRQRWMVDVWKELKLTEGEMDFWQRQDDKIEKPIVYQEYEGYSQMFLSFQTIGFLALLFLSIALSGVFPEEHSRRTDQLILSSTMGKSTLYWAKLTAGITYAAGTVLVFFAVISALTFSLYGSDGFDAAFQLLRNSSSDPITCGQALFIAYGNLLTAALLVSVVVMVLSELLRSGMAALAISAGFMIASMVVSVPEHYRVLAQAWTWQPWCYSAPWYVFGKYTFSVFGLHFPPWQAVPVIYLFLSAAFAFGGKWIYGRYQVSGR